MSPAKVAEPGSQLWPHWQWQCLIQSLLAFLRTSGRFTAQFFVVAWPPRSRVDLSSRNQTWARNGCHLNPKKGPLVQLLHTPAIVATLLAWTSSPAKSPPRIARCGYRATGEPRWVSLTAGTWEAAQVLLPHPAILDGEDFVFGPGEPASAENTSAPPGGEPGESSLRAHTRAHSDAFVVVVVVVVVGALLLLSLLSSCCWSQNNSP